MAKGKGLDWNDRGRKALEEMAKKGYRVTEIAEALGVSGQTVRSELMRGMSEENYKNGRYVQYSAEESIQNQLAAYEKKLRGEGSE